MSGQADRAFSGGVASVSRVPIRPDANGPREVPVAPLAELVSAEEAEVLSSLRDPLSASSQQKAGKPIRERYFVDKVERLSALEPALKESGVIHAGSSSVIVAGGDRAGRPDPSIRKVLAGGPLDVRTGTDRRRHELAR